MCKLDLNEKLTSVKQREFYQFKFFVLNPQDTLQQANKNSKNMADKLSYKLLSTPASETQKGK